MDKAALRTHFTARRNELGAEKQELDALLLSHLLPLVSGNKVAAYSPLGNEPGGADFVAELAQAATELWLPRTRKELEWVRYTGDMQPGTLGILEPVGTAHTHLDVDVVVVPALAIDARGYRLGKGAGYYDRALVGVKADLVGVIFPWEKIETLPAEAHDVPVSAIATAEGTFRL